VYTIDILTCERDFSAVKMYGSSVFSNSHSHGLAITSRCHGCAIIITTNNNYYAVRYAGDTRVWCSVLPNV